MKAPFLMAALLLSASTFAQNSYQPITVREFNQRLESVFAQGNQDTSSEQIIYGSIETILAYKLDSYISTANREAVQSINLQIEALEDAKKHDYFPGSEMDERMRVAKIRTLRQRLQAIEGSIAEKVGKKSIKIVVRGAQVFLILDIGSRIYVLNALSNRDPSFVPLPKIICAAADCYNTVKKVLETSDQAYQTAQTHP